MSEDPQHEMDEQQRVAAARDLIRQLLDRLGTPSPDETISDPIPRAGPPWSGACTSTMPLVGDLTGYRLRFAFYFEDKQQWEVWVERKKWSDFFDEITWHNLQVSRGRLDPSGDGWRALDELPLDDPGGVPFRPLTIENLKETAHRMSATG